MVVMMDVANTPSGPALDSICKNVFSMKPCGFRAKFWMLPSPCESIPLTISVVFLMDSMSIPSFVSASSIDSWTDCSTSSSIVCCMSSGRSPRNGCRPSPVAALTGSPVTSDTSSTSMLITAFSSVMSADSVSQLLLYYLACLLCKPLFANHEPALHYFRSGDAGNIVAF